MSLLNGFWTNSIRNKLVLGVALVHAVLMTLFVSDLVERQRSFLMEQSLDQAHNLAGVLAANSVSWLLVNDVSGLGEVVRSQFRHPHLRYAMLLSPQGRVLAHTDANFTGLYINDPVSLQLMTAPAEHQTLVFNGDTVDVAMPVLSGNRKLIAWARVGLSQQHIAVGLAQVTRKGQGYTLIAILIGTLCAWLIARSLTSGLRELLRVAARVREGYHDDRVNLHRSDELGILAAGFNAMLDVLHRQEQAREAAQMQVMRSKAEFEAIFRAIPDAVIRMDDEHRVLLANPATAQIFGYSDEELQSRCAECLFTSSQDYQAAMLSKDASHTHAQRRMELRMQHKNGAAFWGYLVCAPVHDIGGVHTGFIALIRDISERKQAEQELRLAAQVFANSGEGIFVTDAAQVILMANRAFGEITGYQPSEVLGKNPRLLNSGRHDAEYFQEFFNRLKEDGCWRGEIWNRRKNGEIYPEWLSVSVVKDDTGAVVNYVGIFSDISERIAATESIEFQAHHDALTGLPNRLLLYDRIRQAIAHARRSQALLAILFIDLDRFKEVNDTLGHQAGDELLIGVAERLHHCVRAEDTLCRLGGDEFVILLAGIDSCDDASQVARKVLDAMLAPFAVQSQQASISPSIGISLFPMDGDTPERLIQNADTAMYQVKSAGRNNYCFYRAEMDGKHS